MMRPSVLWIVEVGGDGGQQLAEAVELLVVERGADVAAAEHGLVGPAEARPAALEPVGLVGQIGRAGLELAFEQGDELLRPLVDPRLVDHALGDQSLRRRSALTGGCLAIAAYISGWVKLGSSPSLWPKRR